MRHVHEGATAREVLERLAALIAEAAPAGVPDLRGGAGGRRRRPGDRRAGPHARRHRLTGAAQLAATVGRRLGVDDPDRLAEIRDTIWTMNSPQLYGLLVVQRGWSPERYGAWIARALIALTAP